MELVDKELEDQLVDIGSKLSSPPSDVQQLLLLLDKTENFLSKVEQSPSQSMSTAIRPAMKALVARDILCHSDVDVKAAVASCLSEITRITAPEAPYDDKLMKEIFGLIVEAFKKLDKMSCRSFPKRVSILETVAKVRSCVLMLDLECDDLILEMFHHFFKTIRSNHPEKVFSSMETIMTLVIEENEIITRSLLLCLLDYLRNDQKNIMPITKKLAEKVVINCSSKLKPYLDDFFSGCHSINDYSKIVASVCRGKLDMLLPNQTSFADQTQADDGRLSETAISDELPQEHGALPEKAVAAVEKPCKSVMNNGTCHLENEVSVASDEKPKLSHQDGQSRNSSGAILPISIADTVAVKRNKKKYLNSRKHRGRKAFLRMPVSNDHNLIGSKKLSLAGTARRTGHGKESNFSRADPSVEEVESAEHSKDEKKNVTELSKSSADAVISIPLHSSNEHDLVSPKKGRPPRAKSSGKGKAFGGDAMGDLSSASQHKGFSGRSRIVTSDLPTKDLKLKDLDAHSVSKEKAHQGRKGYRKKVRGVEFLGHLQSDGTEKEIDGRKPADDNERVSDLKELVSSPKSTVIDTANDQSHTKSTTETKSRRKRARPTQEIFGTSKRRKSLNEKLVGSKIKVWWPDDKRFYDGFVDSFDRSTKKHTIVYTDGDIEVLLLRKERWEFIEEESMMTGEENIQDINSLETSKKEKGSIDSVPEKTNVKSPRGRKPVDWTRKNPRKSKGRSASRHLNWNITEDDHLNDAVTISEEATPQAVGRRKHPRSEFGDNVDETIPKRRKSKSKGSKKSMNSSSKPKDLEKSKDDSSPGNESKKSRSASYRPREHKKSNDSSSRANGNSKKSKRLSSKPRESKRSNGDSSRADKRSKKRPADAHVPVIESKRGPRKIKSVKRLQKPGRVTVAQLSKKHRMSNNPQPKKVEAEVRTTDVKKRKRERPAK